MKKIRSELNEPEETDTVPEFTVPARENNVDQEPRYGAKDFREKSPPRPKNFIPSSNLIKKSFVKMDSKMDKTIARKPKDTGDTKRSKIKNKAMENLLFR